MWTNQFLFFLKQLIISSCYVIAVTVNCNCWYNVSFFALLIKCMYAIQLCINAVLRYIVTVMYPLCMYDLTIHT